MTLAPIASRVDPIDVWYLAAGELVPVEVARTVMGFETWRDELVIQHPRMRRVVLRHPGRDGEPPRHNRIGVIHWNDGRDLGDLDQRARRGDDIAADLEAGIWCEVYPVNDVVCGEQSAVAAVGTATSVVTSERRRRHRPSSYCPACGASGFPEHVEVLERG